MPIMLPFDPDKTRPPSFASMTVLPDYTDVAYLTGMTTPVTLIVPAGARYMMIVPKPNFMIYMRAGLPAAEPSAIVMDGTASFALTSPIQAPCTPGDLLSFVGPGSAVVTVSYWG